MEKLKCKHDHKATKALQVVIFFIMMLAPLLAIGVKCAYTIFNPNAKESYYGETINEQTNIYVSTYSDLKVNVEYHFNTITNVTNVSNGYGGSTTSIIVNNVNIEGTIDNLVSKITFYHDANRNYHNIAFRNASDTVLHSYTSLDNTLNNITFNFISISATDLNILNIFLGDLLIHSIDYNNYSYLDNVFYYATSQLTEENLFNWTESTAIYTAINSMLTGLEIGTGTTTLAILLTYWALMSAIYIVFDIIIFCFTKLTHLIQ